MPGESRQAPERLRHLYIRTFGCQMNEYDSLRVQRLLAPLGYVPVQEAAEADLIFLNTCMVRGKAEQKVYSYLGSLRRLKEQKPDLKIIAAGCVAQQLGKKLLQRFDHLDIVLGTRAISSVAEIVAHALETNRRTACLPEEDPALQPGADPGPRLEAPPGPVSVAAPVTIMQGCNNFCTYCIVPYVRGPERSRPSDGILHEIKTLESCGVREVLLLGQNVNSYGRGLAEKIDFAGLLKRVQAETKIVRVRFTTSHPKDLTDDLIACFGELSCLGRNLHLPVQSGSNAVLDRMNRRYTVSRYLQRIERLREICPEIALTSDIIVGFPGETEEDFRRTMALLEEVEFDNLFSFRYSDRPDTKAAGFPEKVDEDTILRRLIELQELQAGITLRKNLAEVGQVREILVEGPSRASNGQMTGRTIQNRIVNFDAPAETVGKLVRVEIVAAYSHSLKGKLILD